MQICISFRSRSDLVLDADHSLDFLSNLVLQACISFCSVSNKSGASLFLPCSHKRTAAHMFSCILTQNTSFPEFLICFCPLALLASKEIFRLRVSKNRVSKHDSSFASHSNRIDFVLESPPSICSVGFRT